MSTPRRSLALIAHDNRKVDLVAWATFNVPLASSVASADLIVAALSDAAGLRAGPTPAG